MFSVSYYKQKVKYVWKLIVFSMTTSILSIIYSVRAFYSKVATYYYYALCFFSVQAPTICDSCDFTSLTTVYKRFCFKK